MADVAAPIFPAGITGVDEAVSVGLETLSIRPIGSLYVAAAGPVISPPFSVAPAFGNVLPPVWGASIKASSRVQSKAAEDLPRSVLLDNVAFPASGRTPSAAPT